MFLKRIDGPPIAASVEPECLAVQLVRSTLCDGVHHASGSSPILRRIVRRIDLELLNRSFAARITDSRPAALLTEERLIVVRAIHGVIVQQSGDSAKADQPKSAIWHCPRCPEREERPPSPVDGQILNGGLVDVRRKVRPISYDNGSFRRSYHGLACRRDIQPRVDWRRPANLNSHPA